MDLGLIQKHEAFIKERWLPISVEFMLQEGPEKKISFLKEAQRQASKEIQNIEEKSVFIGFLEIEILNIQNKLLETPVIIFPRRLWGRGKLNYSRFPHAQNCAGPDTPAAAPPRGPPTVRARRPKDNRRV